MRRGIKDRQRPISIYGTTCTNIGACHRHEGSNELTRSSQGTSATQYAYMQRLLSAYTNLQSTLHWQAAGWRSRTSRHGCVILIMRHSYDSAVDIGSMQARVPGWSISHKRSRHACCITFCACMKSCALMQFVKSVGTPSKNTAAGGGGPPCNQVTACVRE